jgi:hypothetical protein
MEIERGQKGGGIGEHHGEGPKRPYSAPEVRLLGSVRELTLNNATPNPITDNLAGTLFKSGA